jgi:hypothetical protein
MGENHRMLLLYIKRIHSLEAPNSDSLATTRRRIQPLLLRLQPEGSYKSLNSLDPIRKMLQAPELFGFNQKVAKTTYPFPIQPPCNINVDQMSLLHTLPLSIPLSLSLCLCHCHYLINLYMLINQLTPVPYHASTLYQHASIMNQRYINK